MIKPSSLIISLSRISIREGMPDDQTQQFDHQSEPDIDGGRHV